MDKKEISIIIVKIVKVLLSLIIIFITIKNIRKRNRILKDNFSPELAKFAKDSSGFFISFPKNKVLKWAEDPYNRWDLFHILEQTKKLKYFPKDFLSDEAKSEAMVYQYFKENFGKNVILEKFQIIEKIEKQLKHEDIDEKIIYISGTILVNNKQEYFCTGPLIRSMYNMPYICSSSIDFPEAKNPIELIEATHKKFIFQEFK